MISLADVAAAVGLQWWRVLAAGLGVGMAVYLATGFIAPTYTARSTLVPPRQQQAVTALSSLGVLAGAVGSVVAHTGEQYVAFLRSRSVGDRIIARFGLAKDGSPAAVELARRQLARGMRLEVDRKDNLLIIEASSDDPQRAADIANAHVEELRRVIQDLFRSAVDARRTAIERELADATARLRQAQKALQRSGFGDIDLQTDQRATGERFLDLQQRLARAEVRLQQRSAQLDPRATEWRQLAAEVDAIRAQLAGLSGSRSTREGAAPGFVELQRHYHQRERAHADLVRQVEALRLEEARGAPPVPVLDSAIAPQRPVSPRRVRTALLAGAAAAVLALLLLVLRTLWRARPGAMPDARP